VKYGQQTFSFFSQGDNKPKSLTFVSHRRGQHLIFQLFRPERQSKIISISWDLNFRFRNNAVSLISQDGNVAQAA